MTSVGTSLIEIANPPLSPQIVLLERDPSVQARLQRLFGAEGYTLEIANGWPHCKELLRTTPVRVLVLDEATANVSPPRIYEEIRLANPGVAIIILGASSSVTDRILSLELGADDYIAKPFDGREFVARIRAAMRRSHYHVQEFCTFSDVSVDFRKMEVRRQGVPISFTAQEFKVLKFMLQNSERVLSREELLNAAWGYFSYPTTRTVDNHILKLRQKLEPDPAHPVHFLTIHCIGYKFVPRPEAAPPASVPLDLGS